MKEHRLPRLGNRIIKSSAGVLLCYCVYLLRGRAGLPFYSMLAVLWCIQPYTSKAVSQALQRSVGTLIGAVFGLLTILLEIYVIPVYDTVPGYLIIGLMIIPVLYTTVLLGKINASYFSCVVFLSITVVHMTDSDPFIFVFNRVLDTFIGIAVGLLVSIARLPRRKVKDKLFVAELDDMLAPVTEELEPYSKVEINRMLDDGLLFTIVTMRTPAALRKPLADVRLNLPVVVMNGAALYDMRENSYVKAYIISNQTCDSIREIVLAEGMNCFTNALCGDALMIYYDTLENGAEKAIYESMRRSPYRNYLCRRPHPDDRVIYLMVVDKTEKISALRKKISGSEAGKMVNIISYPSDDYPGYSYIKIYNKNASGERMLESLREEYGLPEAVTVGTRDRDNLRTSGRSLNAIAKALKSNFEPIRGKNKR